MDIEEDEPEIYSVFRLETVSNKVGRGAIRTYHSGVGSFDSR